MFSNGRTVIASGQRGFIKVVADSGTGVILGAQLMCQRATDLISQFTAAVVNGLTAEQLRKVMRPHPTFDEASARPWRTWKKNWAGDKRRKEGAGRGSAPLCAMGREKPPKFQKLTAHLQKTVDFPAGYRYNAR